MNIPASYDEARDLVHELKLTRLGAGCFREAFALSESLVLKLDYSYCDAKLGCIQEVRIWDIVRETPDAHYFAEVHAGGPGWNVMTRCDPVPYDQRLDWAWDWCRDLERAYGELRENKKSLAFLGDVVGHWGNVMRSRTAPRLVITDYAWEVFDIPVLTPPASVVPGRTKEAS